MADDLEELLKRAMKTLDEEVPSGYFEGLPRVTLSRLETTKMQTTTGSGGIQRPGVAPARSSAEPQAPAEIASGTTPQPREDDSGLHDIRELARSSKQRISQKRVTSNPPIDEDVLASSSAGWKAVALPEPAKMVSLPELSELPSKKEIKAKDRAAKQAAVAAVDAPTSTPAIGARMLPRAAASSRGKWIAIGGVGLAAAAGVTLFVATRTDDKAEKPAQIVVSRLESPRAVAAPSPTVTPVPPPAATAAAGSAATPAEAPAAAVELAAAPDEQKAAPPADKPSKHVAKGKVAIAKPAGKSADPSPAPPKAEPKADPKNEPKKEPKTIGKKGGKGEDEPSFDDLLKEAGVDQKKQPQKPAIEKKQLSADDFKRGMAAVAGRAQSCYKGSQGTAAVRITIGPNGKVTKVAVSGQFAGKPEADCVVGAVKGAQFPAWDGPSQSFGYSYLLSE